MRPSEDIGSGDAASIEDAATAWIFERDEGFTPERAAAFEAWRREHPRHAAAIAELEQTLAVLGGLAERRNEVNAYFGRVSPARPAAARTPAGNVYWWRPLGWCGVAAALAVAGIFGFRAVQSKMAPETRYATAAAAFETVRLEDGSTLELNAASAVRVRFTAAERRVELETGEAHFTVAHDTARPFIVSAGGVAVRAVGTAFNVRFGAEAVEVTVTEGKVSVRPPSEDRADASRLSPTDRGAPPASLGSAFVGAYERVAVPLKALAHDMAAPAVQRLAPADMRAVLAWQRRVTEFSDTPLADVASRFNLHNVLQLVIADPAVGARRIGGMFAVDDVEAFVRLLEADGIVRAEREGDTVRLLVP